MTYDLPKRTEREMREMAKRHGISRMILFGSRARGTNTDRSDIDIAVSGGDFDSFFWDIKENVHSLLRFDIIDLDRGISDSLREEIERDGVTIYEEDR